MPTLCQNDFYSWPILLPYKGWCGGCADPDGAITGLGWSLSACVRGVCVCVCVLYQGVSVFGGVSFGNWIQEIILCFVRKRRGGLCWKAEVCSWFVKDSVLCSHCPFSNCSFLLRPWPGHSCPVWWVQEIHCTAPLLFPGQGEKERKASYTGHGGILVFRSGP